MVKLGGVLCVAATVALAGAVCAGPEGLPDAADMAPPAGAGSTEGSLVIPAGAPTPVAGIPYYEYFNYSSYAKRSYVPGYTPHVTSLFENPRDYPWALCVLATPYYQYGGIPGWFFSSPQGYQSSVPKGSHASKYYRGELGITKNLRGGYPQGMRVVEPAIVPIGPSAERGGVYIHGGGVTTLAVGTEVTEIIQETGPAPRVPGPAPIVPGPAPTPASLEK